jgi:hypothetical protein
LKKTFYAGLAGIALFEILKVYFIMPMPGSQGIESLDVAYFLQTYRWCFRIVFLLMVAVGIAGAFRAGRNWLPAAATIVAALVFWLFNFPMMADTMFQQVRNPSYKNRADNLVDESSVVIGVDYRGEARAYPIRFLVYHHQVQDTIGGRPVMVTYCSVCRTGRVFEPIVNGQPEKFRLVGMDHFNAMFEDTSTRSWWRQATGEAVAGPLKGARLPEAEYSQLTLHKWFELHPASLVMQPDESARDNYDPEGKYERGKSKGDLTRTNPLSWQDKSWVVGVQIGSISKAYDWNRLKQDRIINDQVNGTPVVLALAIDQKSFAVFVRPSAAENFTIARDILQSGGRSYDFSGRDPTDASRQLEQVKGYQEFWHSWRTFHPGTQQYK